MSAIRVSEIFGPTVGTVVADLLERAPMEAEDILSRVEQLTDGNPVLVTLSGGNPAIQPFGELIALGKARHHRFAMETQGSVAND